MPSKGIDVFYYSALPKYQVEFTVPGSSVKSTEFRNDFRSHLEVDSKKIEGRWNYTGRFSFRVTDPSNSEITNQFVEVNALTGDLGDGTMNKIEQMRAVILNGVLVTYGFYDAGSGVDGLPNAHQCYVTVSADKSRWMGDVAPKGSKAADLSFARFALPCPHDCGMNSMQSSHAVLNGPAFEKFVGIFPLMGMATTLSTDYISKVIYALAITQKDSIDTMLKLGARYFEFRPGRLPQEIADASNLGSNYYFLHSVIPGLIFDAFLDIVLQFLESNPDEIIVVHLRDDGIKDPPCIKIDHEHALQAWEAAASRISNKNVIGNSADFLQRPIRELRDTSKRLIIVEMESQNSSWDEADYSALNADRIVSKFETMHPNNDTFLLLQCQATATGLPDVVKHSILSSNSATSCLMATKGICDSETLPWIRQEALARFGTDQCLVVMNDWLDGATCDVAIELSKQRIQASGD